MFLIILINFYKTTCSMLTVFCNHVFFLFVTLFIWLQLYALHTPRMYTHYNHLVFTLYYRNTHLVCCEPLQLTTKLEFHILPIPAYFRTLSWGMCYTCLKLNCLLKDSCTLSFLAIMMRPDVSLSNLCTNPGLCDSG